MRIAILGLPQSGKTTLFNLLTGQRLPVGAMQAGVHVESGTLDLVDERVQALSMLVKPKKTTCIQMRCDDLNGIQPGEGLPGGVLDHLAKADLLLLVLRAFDDPAIPHPLESIDVQRDLELLRSELLLNDLVRVESLISRWQEERGKGLTSKDQDLKLAKRLKEALEAETPLRELPVTDSETLSGLGLLTLKPLLLVISLEEGQKPPTLESEIATVALQTKLELEIAELGDEDREAYRAEYGIQDGGRSRVLQAALHCMGRITFFTLNENEVKAWPLSRGATALDAAGAIHSDLARGFIRAEVIQWERLIELGGLSEARSAGDLRVEGKDYPVQDGEVVYIRFHV